jgi:hypothetical protein
MAGMKINGGVFLCYPNPWSRGSMSKSTAWICLSGGVFLLVLGVLDLIAEGKWVVFILSLLIIAFSLSSLFKKSQNS